MARSFTMAPQAPRSGTAKPSPTKHQATAPHGAHGHNHPHTTFRPQRSGGLGRLTLLVLVLAFAGAGLWYWLGGGKPALDPGAQLLAQMEAAAQGNVAPTHAFGGALTVSAANGRTNVVAEGVPSRACVQVGWRLARSGTIIVNGVLSQRLSAAKLSEMCSGDDATLLWVPDQ